MTEKKRAIAEGIESTRIVGEAVVDSSHLPWLKADKEKISITEVRTYNKQKIYIASCLSPDLASIAEKMANSRQTADQHFYQLVNSIAENNYQNLPRLQSPVSNYPIYYSKQGDHRVYVLVVPAGKVSELFPSTDGKTDLVIRIAQCAKSREQQVLSKITKM